MAVSSSNSDAANWNELNNFMRDARNDQSTRVIKDDKGTRVVMLDKNGLRTTAVDGGIDVFTATDSQLTFDSRRSTFQVVDEDTVTLAVPSLASGATTTVTVAHGLSSVPAVLAYVSGTGSTYLQANKYYSMSVTIPVVIGGVYQAGIQYTFRVDATNIYFDVSNYTSAGPITDIGTATFHYYILTKTAA